MSDDRTELRKRVHAALEKLVQAWDDVARRRPEISTMPALTDYLAGPVTNAIAEAAGWTDVIRMPGYPASADDAAIDELNKTPDDPPPAGPRLVR